jgi:hypothetical protein
MATSFAERNRLGLRVPAVRKIISFTHATLDGSIDEPHEWSFRYADEELQVHALEMTLAADALLLGRITYEGMAQAWPERGGNPFADHGNSITKYVVASRPVDTAAWEPSVVIAGAELLDTKVFATGAVVQAYRPVSTG